MSTYQQQVKKQTTRQVLNYIKFKENFTASELTTALKKTLPTINSYIKYLVERGYVTNSGEESGQLGRPAVVWVPTIFNLKSIAVEVQLQKIIIAQITLKGEILSKEEYTIIGDNLLEEYYQHICSFLEKYDLQKTTKMIGISVPGPVDFSRKKVLYSANLGIRNLDFSLLEERLRIPILIENNANAAALGEFFLDTDKKDKIYISITKSGIGGGQILEQKLQRGVTRKGGELGHMSIDLYGISCACGRRGCLERYVSEQGFLDIAKRYGIENTTVDDICTNPNTIYQRIISEYVVYLGKGIQNLMFILDPSTIIIGGFVSKYWSIFEPLLIDEVLLNNNITDESHRAILRPAVFQDKTSLYGAGLLTYLSLFYEDSVYS